MEDYSSDYETEDYKDFLLNHNYTEMDIIDFAELDFMNDPFTRVIAALYGVLITSFGIIVNLIIIYAIVVKWRIQTPFNLFVVNLAIADITLTISSLVNLITHSFVGSWIFGNFMCQVFVFFDHSSAMISIFLMMTALVVLQTDIGIKISSLIIGIVYLISTIISMFPAKMSRVIQISGSGESDDFICETAWPSKNANENFEEFIRVLQIKLPLIVLTLYAIIRLIQRLTSMRILKGFIYDKLLILMIGIYVILWMPLLFFMHHIEELPIDNVKIYLYAMNLFVGCSMIYKPIIYLFMHEGIRKELKEIFITSDSGERDRFF